MQIVGYRTGDAGLLVSEGESVEFVPLEPGAELAYALGRRRCAGAFDGDAHVACGAADAPYCPEHRSAWVCARCTGDCLKDEMDCHEAHAIYLAAFAPAEFKVGVTRERRLDTRLREQGADRAAHVRTVANGRVAREIEADISASTPVPDRVRVDTKRRGLGRSVEESAWRDLLAAFDPIETFAFDYGLDLAARPVAETVATGTVRGTKGRLLILDHAGSAYAVDLRDLVGHEVEPRRTDRDLQSSLSAFG